MLCEGYGTIEGCEGEATNYVCLDGNMETDMCDNCIKLLRESGEVDVEVLDV
ncbi:MAG TPA: hypothetical protein VH593_25335 [Ktedonobacteraceae bacterium]|jgi:hypothetical protein